MSVHALPSVLGVGPQRTGSTWLHEQLSQHPALCFPHNVKETFFFDRHYGRGFDWYAWHFGHAAAEQVLVEIGPTYFDDEAVPERVYEANPDCRIIVTLREPVARARSLYQHHLRKGRVSGSFSEAAEQMPRILTAGHYAEHVGRWISVFGRDHLHIVLLDDIRRTPVEALSGVCDFLGIPVLAPTEQAFAKTNAASMPRFPWLAAQAARAVTALRSRRFHRIVEWGKALGLNRVYQGNDALPQLTTQETERVQDQFAPDVEYVERLTGRPLPHWTHARPAATA